MFTAVIDILILLLILFITYKAILLKKLGNKRTTFMIFLLNLTIIADIIRNFYLGFEAEKGIDVYTYFKDDFRARIYLSEITAILL